MISEEVGLLGTSRSSTRLVNTVPPPGPAGSNSPSPEGTGYEQGDVAATNGASRKRGREPIPTVEILTSSRRRCGLSLILITVMSAQFVLCMLVSLISLLFSSFLFSCVTRIAPASLYSEGDQDLKDVRRVASAPSSSANAEDDEDEEEIKEEVNNQDIEEEEVEAESAPSVAGSGRGGARTAGGFGGKKKPRKQRRV